LRGNALSIIPGKGESRNRLSGRKHFFRKRVRVSRRPANVVLARLG
jgi:hypothetical protein